MPDLTMKRNDTGPPFLARLTHVDRKHWIETQQIQYIPVDLSNIIRVHLYARCPQTTTENKARSIEMGPGAVFTSELLGITADDGFVTYEWEGPEEGKKGDLSDGGTYSVEVELEADNGEIFTTLGVKEMLVEDDLGPREDEE